MKISNIFELKNLLKEADKVLITTHTNPDGDAIGSSLALYHFLSSMQKDVSIVVPNKYPSFISWLPGDDKIVVYEKSSKKAKGLIESAKVIFCLDYNAIHRSGVLQDILKVSSVPRVMVDHHPEPELDDFQYIISDVNTSSTSELLYEFMSEVDENFIPSREIASCLYVGIMTDTGSFSFACNRPETFEITAKLLQTGIDGEKIHRKVYDTFSEDRLRLLGFSLSEALVVKKEYATAYIALSRKDLDRFNFRVGDTEGIVNYALSIKGINLACLLTERKGRIRLSFRSKGKLSVNDIARNHFNGGGHRNAAGGDVYDSLPKAVQTLESILPEYKDEILDAENE